MFAMTQQSPLRLDRVHTPTPLVLHWSGEVEQFTHVNLPFWASYFILISLFFWPYKSKSLSSLSSVAALTPKQQEGGVGGGAGGGKRCLRECEIK